ncbi:MAG: ABC transporter permease [Bradymonadaceae bacterium]
MSGLASLPDTIAGGDAETPDVYIGSEHLFNYGKWFSGVSAGPGIRLYASLGPSMKTDRLVLEGLLAGLPFTLQLGLQALLLALVIGVPAGMYAGLRQNTMADYTTMTFAMVGVAIPNFVLGPILILIFALGLGWFRAGGWNTFADSILPTITLSLYYAAYIARLTRGGMLEMIRKDFVRTARAKGLTEKVIVFRHTLKGTLLPVVSYLGPAFAALLTGSVVVEKIFSIPGIGTRFVESALNRDYNMVLGTVIIYSSFLVTLNLLVDIVYTWLDPRVSYDDA